MMKNCIICKQEIYRGGWTGQKGRGKNKRNDRAVTCGPSHSRIYGRVYRYVQNMIERRLKKI